MPNEELQQAIAWFENRLCSAVMPGAREMFGIALSALREKLEREKEHIGEANEMIAKPANEPLTLEQLREMGGEPVYIQRIPYNSGEWHICRGERKYKRHGHAVISMGNGWLEIEEEYGETWIAYRNKPKEAANG